MTTTRLHDVLEDVARDAPEVRIPAGLYHTARRRRRWRRVCSAAAAIVIVALTGLIVTQDPPPANVAAGGSPGLPDRLVMPPPTTDTVSHSPAGPASVVFSAGENAGLSDHEDFSWAWWRDSAVYPSVAVGLDRDTYRVARGAYTVGTELSPDGRYLLMDSKKMVDLQTGKARQVLPPNPSEVETGRWSADGRWITYSEWDTTTVVSWPSKRVEWTIKHPEQEHAAVALSPDGSMAALFTNHNATLSVYRRDGTRLWTKSLGRDWGGGHAAWRTDGKLAMFQLTDLVCDDCGWHPGTWRLTLLDAMTGTAVDGPRYPAPRSLLNMRVVAWRDDTAYAVARYSTPEPPGGWDSNLVSVARVELVRLRPGASEPETLLTAPAGSEDLGVATDYVDTLRSAGPPEFGYNEAEIAGPIVTIALCLSPFVVLTLWVSVRRRRLVRSPR